MLGLILFAVTIVAFRDYRKLEHYRYPIVLGFARAVAAPPRARDRRRRSTAPIWGSVSRALLVFQPTEFAKIGLVIFLASYLRDTRQVLVLGARRILGITIPPIKHFGPVLVIWGVAMVILVLLHDIGSSLMFYGALLAMLYVATGRLSFVVIGLLAFALGAWYLGTHIPHVHARVEAWLHPFNPMLYNEGLGSSRSPTGSSPRRPAGCSAGIRRSRCSTLIQRGAVGAGAADRHDLRRHHRRAGAVRRRARCCSPTCCSSPAASRRR